MDQLTIFYAQYGWQLTLIAILGIVLLGILKEANAFSKVDKPNRKPIYLLFSAGFSIVASGIYLLIIGKFEINYFVGAAGAIYAINQVMYATYENTKLRDVFMKLYNFVKEKVKLLLGKKDEQAEEVAEDKQLDK